MKAIPLAVTGALALMAGGARADTVIGSFEVVDEGGFGTVFDTMDVSLGMVKDFVPIPPNQIFFESHLQLGASDVGTTWTSDPATTALMREQWQDGDMNDSIGIIVELELPNGDTFGYGQGAIEFDFPTLGLDLTTIANETDAVRVTLQSFMTDSPGINPNGDGVWTDYSVSYLFEFVSVPAPGAWSLLVVGGIVAGRRRRRA